MDGTFDLKDFVINVLRQWKIMLIMAMVFGALLGGIKLTSGMKELENSKEAKNQPDSESIEVQKNLKSNIESLNKGINNWDEYYANSKLTQIDSYNAKRYGLVFLVENGSEEQTNGVAVACEKLVDSGKYYQELSEKSAIALEDVKELVYTDVSQNCVELRGYQVEDENMEGLIERLFEKINEEFNAGTFGDFQVRKISADYYVGRDDRLIELQDRTISNGEKYITEVNSRTRLLENLQEETGNLEVTEASIMSSAIKFGIAGVLGGTVLGLFLGLFKEMMSTKLKSEKELQSELGMKCLGDSLLLKRKENIVDKIIHKLEGRKDNTLNINEWNAYICARMDNEKTGKNLVLTSTLPKETMAPIYEGLKSRMMQENSECICEDCVSVVCAGEAIKQVAKADGVVLFERLNKSNLLEIEKEKKIIEEMNIKILGFVMV